MSKPEVLEGSVYLVIKHIKPHWQKKINVVRTTISTPALKANEITLKVNLKLPEALFNRPQLQANIIIDEDKVTPNILDAEVQENITEIIEKQLGIDLTINLVEPEE